MIGVENITWLGHASFRIKNSKVLYIDPWKLKAKDPADIILVTHTHYDHCSAEDINKILKKDTVIVAPEDCTLDVPGNFRSIKPGERLVIEKVAIEAVPAYNINKPFHAKSSNWVGFIITIEDTKIYHAGDTDYVPELNEVKADIALLPIGGTYTMDVQEAARLANKIRPKVVCPMHYGDIVGREADALEFKKLCNVDVQILR